MGFGFHGYELNGVRTVYWVSDEAVLMAAFVKVISNDLSRGVDAVGFGRETAWDINGRENALVVKETVLMAAFVKVSSDDLPGRVYI